VGTIVHYDGNSFTRKESGTELPIQDIWGVVDEVTGETIVLMVASRSSTPPLGKALLQIREGNISFISDNGLSTAIKSVWIADVETRYIVGAGVFTWDSNHDYWVEDTLNNHPLLYKHAVRGTGINDVYVVGAYGHVSHYNGSTWRHFVMGDVPSFYGKYKAVSVTNKIMVAVGWLDQSCVILRGYPE
jgi:hypothetical protein